MLSPLVGFFAVALMLAPGACDNARPLGDAPADPDAIREADPQEGGTGASAPLPKQEPAEAAADTCELRRELQAWSDSSLATARYGTYVVVRLAMMENEASPLRTPEVSAALDSSDAVVSMVCRTAHTQELNSFLASYRRVRPSTVLTQDVVRTLSDVSTPIAASVSDTADSGGPATRDSANQWESNDTESRLSDVPAFNRVDLPWIWLVALIGFITVAAAALGYALWRLGGMIRRFERWVQESHRRNFQRVGEQIDQSVSSLKNAQEKTLKDAQQQALTETKNYFGRISNEVAILRERVMESLRGKGGTGALSGADGGMFYADGRTDEIVLGPDSFAEWEKNTVDVRLAEGGSATIHADDTYGVFIVRWVRDSGEEARLSVDPSKLLGAVYRDKLDAAFQCQGVARGTGRYRTVEEARCTWDPATKQGSIIQHGRVEEVG